MLNCSSRKPCSTARFTPCDPAFGVNSSAAPASPTAIPPMVGACSRSPPGSSASMPTIQNGEVVMINPAIPLGILVSAKPAPHCRSTT